MVLLRSHFEGAAMAAHCLTSLSDAARKNRPEDLSDLIPKTLFGTSLKKHGDKESVGKLLAISEGNAFLRICNAVKSLDSFYYQDVAESELEIVYSLLCDFSHPNHRGVLDFMHHVERPDGWYISYSMEELPNPEMAVHALEILLVSMRSGYAASELLRSWRFQQKDNSTIDWHGPSEDDGARIWQRFLQRPLDESIS